MRRDKFSSKNAYVKVEGEGLDKDSNSEEKSDLLSFSYSCVKSFRKNQHIIGDLAALHGQHNYQEIDHQPRLFSLSGERNRPICQPFYCSTMSENSSEKSFGCGKKQSVVEKEKNLINSESQHQFPVKDLLFKWLKYHFKQVNNLWSFSIPKENFISKLCKRNKNMKMEMTLYSVDEETKRKLINYIHKSNLGFEEHFNLCNETVFEIDVTPILNDTQRLQNFMSFIKSIESEKSKVSNKKSPDMKKSGDSNEDQPEINIINKKHPKKKILDEFNESHRKPEVLEKCVYQTCSLSEISAESEINIIPKPKQYTGTLKKNSNYKNLKPETKIIFHKHDEDNDKKLLQREQRARYKSTIYRTNDSKNDQKNKTVTQKKIHFEQLCCNLQTNDETNLFISTSGSELSCKCDMHNNRQDYYRYRNQCLFGKGDEMTNCFSKYVKQRENQLEPSVHLDGNQLESFSSEIYDFKHAEKLKISKSNKSLVTKTISQNESNNIFLGSFRRSSLKQDLYSQDHCNGSLKENLCPRQFSSVSTDNNFLDKERELNVLATNACFESLSYYFNTVSNTTNESSARKNMQERNNICCSAGRYSCRYKETHREHTDSLNNSFELYGQSKRKINKNIIEKSCNTDFRVEDDLSPTVCNLNNNMPINEQSIIYSENVKQKVKLNINDGITDLYKPESKEYDSPQDDGITRGINKKLQKLRIKNTSSPNGNKTNFKDNKQISPPRNGQEDCVIDCGYDKNEKHQSKVKIIVFRIGNSYKQFKNNPNSASKKISHKSKSISSKSTCRNISSDFKENGSLNDEECSIGIWNNQKTDENINYCSITEECNSFTDSLTSRSKDITQKFPKISPDLNLSSLSFYDLETLVYELKSQRKEIDSMKKLLNYHIT